MPFSGQSLPDFENPPVIEVVLGFQFDEISELDTPHLGLLWSKFRTRFPRTEDHSPLDPVFESFEPEQIRPLGLKIEYLHKPPIPRCWFLNNEGTELVQVQNDRIIHNWRKIGDGEKYPRYEKVKETFMKDIAEFQSYLALNKFPDISVNQWEVTYVNHIPLEPDIDQFGQFDNLVTVWENKYSDGYLSKPESAQFNVRYLIHDNSENPIGRLHINFQPGYRREDKIPIIIMTLTARGRPISNNLDGAYQSLDIGREHVVRGFTSITTVNAHKKWGRRDVKTDS